MTVAANQEMRYLAKRMSFVHTVHLGGGGGGGGGEEDREREKREMILQLFRFLFLLNFSGSSATLAVNELKAHKSGESMHNSRRNQ